MNALGFHNAFWFDSEWICFGVLLFLQNKGELGAKGQKRGGILQLAPPLKKGNSKGPLNFLGGISRKLIDYNTSTILIHYPFTGLVGLT